MRVVHSTKCFTQTKQFSKKAILLVPRGLLNKRLALHPRVCQSLVHCCQGIDRRPIASVAVRSRVL